MKTSATLLFGILLCATPVFSQSEINQLDTQGKRHGVWKKFFEGTEQLRYEGTFEHGKEVGEFKFYCESCKNQPMVIKNFSRKEGVAEVQYFTIKGKLVSKGRMQGKNRIGEWVYYHEKSNNIMTREHYSNGKLDGKIITYYPNGKITQETSYVNGIKQGEDNYYSPEGVLLKNLNYTADQLQGPALYFDAYGNVVIEGFYKDNKKHGLWKYYKDGKVIMEETFPKPKH